MARFCGARLPNAVVVCPAPPPRWPFVRPSGSLAAGGFGGQWPARGQAFAAGGFGGAWQTPTAPTHPTHPSAVDVATRDDLTRNIGQLKNSRIFAAESAQLKRCKVSLKSYLTMAKMQGITGKLSGKMGSAVFRVREGQQVVAQYNPIVKNPNTEGQQAQRAKFKLMSQLAAIMAPAMGSFIIKTRAEKGKPSQRNAFTQLNFPLVVVTSDDQEVTAKIPMEQLQLTSSFRHLPDLTLTTEGQGEILVTMEGIAPDVSAIRLFLVGYSNKVAEIVHMRQVHVEQGSIGQQSIVTEGGGKFTVLAYGLIPSESAKASINLDNIHTPADEDFISAVELNAMVAAGQMVETRTVGANVTVSR